MFGTPSMPVKSNIIQNLNKEEEKEQKSFSCLRQSEPLSNVPLVTPQKGALYWQLYCSFKFLTQVNSLDIVTGALLEYQDKKAKLHNKIASKLHEKKTWILAISNIIEAGTNVAINSGTNSQITQGVNEVLESCKPNVEENIIKLRYLAQIFYEGAMEVDEQSLNMLLQKNIRNACKNIVIHCRKNMGVQELLVNILECYDELIAIDNLDLWVAHVNKITQEEVL